MRVVYIKYYQVLSSIMKANLCPGSPKDHFVQLLENCTGGKRYNRSGEMIAYIQNRQGCLKQSEQPTMN